MIVLYTCTTDQRSAKKGCFLRLNAIRDYGSKARHIGSRMWTRCELIPRRFIEGPVKKGVKGVERNGKFMLF